MRKDVKIGLVISFVFVVVAGLYYVGRDKKADPVKLDDSTALVDKAAGSPAKGPVASAADNRLKPGANRPPGKPIVPQPNPRLNPKPPASGSLTPPAEGPAAQPRTDSGLANGPRPEAPLNPSAAAKESNPGPVASASPTPNPIDNLFKFDKDATEPGKPGGDSLTVKASDATSPKLGPATGIDAAKSNLPPAGASKAPDSGEPMRTHKVERGDSYSLLAEQFYGSQRFTQFLIDANPQFADPTKLREGIVLRVPPKPGETATVKKASSLVPGSEAKTTPADKAGSVNDRVYVVKEDDTLYAIATRELGKGTRWPELMELNKDILKGSPERLRVGQSLKLPPTAKSEPTKRP